MKGLTIFFIKKYLNTSFKEKKNVDNFSMKVLEIFVFKKNISIPVPQ